MKTAAPETTRSHGRKGSGSHLFLPRYDVVRVGGGFLLLIAALLKGYQLATEPVFTSGFFGSRLFFVCLVELEMALGAWLISGVHAALARRASLACFSVFGCGALARGLAGETSCGCFGAIAVSPWIVLPLDFVVAGLFWISKPPSAPPRARSWRALVLALAILTVGLPSAWRMRSYTLSTVDMSGIPTDAKSVVIVPSRWIGKQLPLLPWIDIGERLTTGDWTVVLYRSTCPHCRAALEHYARRLEQRPTRGAMPRYAFIQLPPFDADRGSSPLLRLSPLGTTFGRVADTKRWFVNVPIEMKLANGVVKAVAEPSGTSLSGVERGRFGARYLTPPQQPRILDRPFLDCRT